MGQKVLKPLITVFLSVFLFLAEQTHLYAQISLENDNLLEVRFSQGESGRNQALVTVGLSEIESILSPEFTLPQKQWLPFGEQTNSDANFFVSENDRFVAPGRMQVKGVSDQTFFISSFTNNSGYGIGNIIVAYDFIYNFYERPDVKNYSLELKYKVNEGDWTKIQNGFVETSALQSTNSDWQSFSIQLNLDDIFLRESDTIHLMWVMNGSDMIPSSLPLALQRIEVIPEKVESSILNRGDLIISEIMPKSNVDGFDFEYVEVYNPGENSVSLKGVELNSPLGSVVIQKDIYVDSYGYTVISNTDISNFERVDNSYFYNGSIIAENGGRINLEKGGNLIASATYEAAEAGVAVELNRSAQAYDGYSSLQDFAPSQTSLYQDLYGTPGFSGSTIPMFTKELKNSGLYLLSFPGSIVEQLNRHPALEYYNLAGEALAAGSIDPYISVFVHKTSDEPLSIYVEGSLYVTERSRSFPLTSGSAMVSVPVSPEEGSRFSPEADYFTLTAPISQVWNQQLQKFEFQFPDQIQQDHWTPFVVNSSTSANLNTFTSESKTAFPRLDRFIEFTLTSDADKAASYSDEAILGFINNLSQDSENRFDLPKLELNHSMDFGQMMMRQPLLFLTSSQSQENYNSFTHLPFEIDQEYEIGLGMDVTAGNSGSAVLRWRLTDDIPDEWVLLLEDTFSGTQIDLREENEYRFRYNSHSASEVINEEDSGTPKLSTLSPQNRSRFKVRVEPFETFSEQVQEKEAPDSIELRPNYPNPFNPSTNINFYLPEEKAVRVGIYNIVGQQVAVLLDDTVQQGEHSLMWDASDKPSGIYIVQLETGNRIFTRKITLIK